MPVVPVSPARQLSGCVLVLVWCDTYAVFSHSNMFPVGFSFFVNVYIQDVMINCTCQLGEYFWLRLILYQ